MPAHRQSALLLHGLGRADQRWILSQLADQDARVLRAHLDELKELGIPADRSLAGSVAPDDSGAAHAAVHRAAPAHLQLVLADEPAWMLAQLLALRAWPWRAAFLETLPAGRRAAVESAAPAPLAPQAAQALVAAVAAALPAQLAPPAVRQDGALSLARRSLRRWF